MIHSNCGNCGPFAINEIELKMFEHEPWFSTTTRRKLSALNKEHTLPLRKRPTMHFVLGDRDLPKVEGYNSVRARELLQSRWPIEPSRQLERAFGNMITLSAHPGAEFPLPPPEQEPTIYFAESGKQAEFYRAALQNRGYLRHQVNLMYSITLSGWEWYESLSTKEDLRNPAFIAMYFGIVDDGSRAMMAELYDSAIAPAVINAGYRAIRSDSQPHDNFIMNKIIGDIREAPFVVADFTDNRNGVYFEAGYARGLGKTVIHTCREDHLHNAHFDIKQINTIIWKKPEDLYEGIHQAIRAIVGIGPYDPQELRREIEQPSDG